MANSGRLSGASLVAHRVEGSYKFYFATVKLTLAVLRQIQVGKVCTGVIFRSQWYASGPTSLAAPGHQTAVQGTSGFTRPPLRCCRKSDW